MVACNPSERFRPADAREVFIDVNKILLAIDGSKSSVNATKYAMGLAQMFGAKIRAVFVDPSLEMLDDSAQSIDQYLQDSVMSTPGFQGLVIARVYAIKNGISFEEMIARGNVVGKLIETSQEFLPDLIVMGNSEKAGIRRAFGSVVNAVVKGTDIPILVV